MPAGALLACAVWAIRIARLGIFAGPDSGRAMRTVVEELERLWRQPFMRCIEA